MLTNAYFIYCYGNRHKEYQYRKKKKKSLFMREINCIYNLITKDTQIILSTLLMFKQK